jgi:dephospho-CoA kinase
LPQAHFSLPPTPNLPDTVLLVALTGNIASGKSEVTRMLEKRGATIVDADELSREAVLPGSRALQRIVDRWGNGVLKPDGSLDRDALRNIVFNDPDQLEELNGIVHPEVNNLRERELDRARVRGDRIVVCVIPLLFEKHLAERFDRIVLVDAPRPVRLERLVATRGLDEAEAMNMIAAQMPAELKSARADHVIENTGSLKNLERAVEKVWSALERDAISTVDAASGRG